MEEAVRFNATKPASIDRETQSLSRCEHALELLLTHRGNPSAEVERVLADDPQCVFAHCLNAALIVCADAAGSRSSLAGSAAAIELACPDMHDPARRHAAAARAWLEGGAAAAVERYGAIVREWPHDILALQVAHALDFRLGRRQMLRDRVAQVLPKWEISRPGYASVLAMYAFGLEENGQYRRAEKTARRALAIDPRHPGAIHVIAHVMEMQGRFRQGLAFLAATEPAWLEGTGFSVHLAWHRALVPSRRGRFERRACHLRRADREPTRSGHFRARRCFCIALAAPTPKRRCRRSMAPAGRSLGDTDFSRCAALLCRARHDGVRRGGTRLRGGPRVRGTAAHRRERRPVASGGSAGAFVLRSAACLRPRGLCWLRRMVEAGASHRAAVRRQSRTMRSGPSHVYRGGVADTECAPSPHPGDGTSGTETSEPTQSPAAATLADDTARIRMISRALPDVDASP